jgi:predicted GIY-YIG superfamily endonuclease
MVSPTPRKRRGVEVAESPKPAPANENPPKVLTLSQRMAAIRDEAFGIGKDNIKMKSKAGVEFTIKGHTVEAVLSEMRPLLTKHGVDMTPNLVERTYNGNRCDILVDFEFENLDDAADRRVIRWAGAGTDDGDKGFSKAGTNALKEMLKKRFLITDRDDAKEETEAVEHQTEASQASVQKAQEKAKRALQQWAATFKAALETAETETDVKRLERDNKDQLTDENLPEITRTFFAELIHDRKQKLAAKEDGQ